jgi:hypothetical protein
MALMEHETRVSNENHAIFTLINWLHPPPPYIHKKYSLIQKLLWSKLLPATQRGEDYEKEREVTIDQSVFGSGTIYPDPDPTSEKFQIRSGSYLAQYGISNKKCCTKSCLFNV